MSTTILNIEDFVIFAFYSYTFFILDSNKLFPNIRTELSSVVPFIIKPSKNMFPTSFKDIYNIINEKFFKIDEVI